MRRESFADGAPAPGRIVHVVGRVTHEVFGFLGPATAVLARHGATQQIILIDDARHRELLARMDERIELVVIDGRAGPLRAWRAVRVALEGVLRGDPVHAVHAHGAVAYLMCGFRMRRLQRTTPLYYSPYRPDRRGFAHAATRVVLRLVVALLGPVRSLAGVGAETEALPGPVPQKKKVEVIERPLAPEFLAARRRESRRPLLVGGHAEGDLRSIERFARLAVLLSGEPLGLAFNWIGPVDALSERRLQAAAVGVFAASAAEERAGRLAAGWVFVAPLSGAAVAAVVIEAMAAGVPVVALDVPHYRDLIQDGETGYLCGTEEQMLDRIAWLIDKPLLRRQIGQAARVAARQRFSERRFSDSVLAAYSLTAPQSFDELSS